MLPSSGCVRPIDGAGAGVSLLPATLCGAFRINGEVTAPQDYVPALKKRLDPRARADRVVFVTSEDDAAYKKLVEALEGARHAGAETLGTSDEPPPAAAPPAAAPPAAAPL